MNKTKNTFLILALVFVAVTLVLFSVTVYYASSTIYLVYHDKPSFGDVFGGMILWILVVMYGIFTIVAAGGILPFDLLLMNKCKVKTWYTKLMFIFSITMMALTLLSMLSLPIASNIYHATRHVASSSSSASI